MADLHRNSKSFLSSQALRVPSEPNGSSSTQYSRIFGLVIGINQYPHKSWNLQALTGAVADADSVSQFLIQHRDANPDRITNLRDAQATRSAIVDSLKDLASNPKIQQGDTVIVYFAGHTSKDISNEEIPISLWAVDSSSHGPELYLTGEVIYDHLDAITKAKGANVVLVLDTCYSGCFAPEYIRNTTSTQNTSERGDSNQPYVLVAACRARESTDELNGRGRFTSTMLNVLINRYPTSYVELITFIRADYKQQGSRLKPDCYGYPVKPQVLNVHGSLHV